MVVVSMDWGPFYKAYESIRHPFYTHSVPQADPLWPRKIVFSRQTRSKAGFSEWVFRKDLNSTLFPLT